MHERMNGRLPREARLRGHDVFGRIFRQSEGLRRGELVVKYRIEKEPPAGAPATGVRAGFVVRRSAGTAVRRNRIRRLLREAYRTKRMSFVKALPSGMNLDLVVLWSGTPEQALRPSFEAIEGEMGAALNAIVGRLRKRADGRAEQR